PLVRYVCGYFKPLSFIFYRIANALSRMAKTVFTNIHDCFLQTFSSPFIDFYIGFKYKYQRRYWKCDCIGSWNAYISFKRYYRRTIRIEYEIDQSYYRYRYCHRDAYNGYLASYIKRCFLSLNAFYLPSLKDNEGILGFFSTNRLK